MAASSLPWGSEAVPRQRGWGWELGQTLPKVFILDGNFMRVLKGLIKGCLGDINLHFNQNSIAAGSSSEDCPVLPLLSKYSQCVNSVSSSYTFYVAWTPFKEMVLILQSSSETTFSYDGTEKLGKIF